MKTELLTISFFCVLLSIGCRKEEEKQLGHNEVTTKVISNNSSKYAVSKEDLLLFIGNDKQILNIQEYKGGDNMTLFYIVNYQNAGYEIIAGDKRAFPYIANCDKGNIDILKVNDNFKAWINELSNRLIAISNCSNITIDMKNNIETWNYITTRLKKIVETKTGMTYYYLISSTTRSYYSTNKGPLLESHWGQDNNYWNGYCPWEDSTLTGRRCPAGCVMVATGQFAYYMRNRSLVNISIPVSASCSGYAGSFTQTFSDTRSNSYINEMPLNYYETDTSKIRHIRILLAYLGHRFTARYSINGTKANMAMIPPILYEWGLQTYYRSYNDSIVYNRIIKNTPIIAGGYNNSEGHAWVIDGYREINITRCNYYYVSEVELSESQISNLTMADWNRGYDEWEMRPEKLYHMNWGWDGSEDNWCSYDNWAPNEWESFSNNQEIYVSNQFN